MTKEIEREELELYVAERIAFEMNKYLTKSDLGRKLSEPTGVSKSSLMNDVNWILAGHLESWLGVSREFAKNEGKKRRFATLSYILYELRIEESDELVSRLRAAYQDFVYPPAVRE